VKLLDSLFGRTKPVRSRADQLFAISTAAVTLQTQLNLKPSGRGGLALRPLSASEFGETEKEMRALLETSARETGSRLGLAKDDYGYLWVVVQDEQFEDVVSMLYTATIAMADAGYMDQVLAALFEFRDEDGSEVDWIYNFKRATFYPFIPLVSGQRRDNAAELRLAAVMEKELPIEKDPGHWYALWSAPLHAAGHSTKEVT